MKADFTLRSEFRGQIVVAECADAVKPLPTVIRVEIPEEGTNVELLVASPR